MDFSSDKTWILLTFPTFLDTQNLSTTFLIFSLFAFAFLFSALSAWFRSPGGHAWANTNNQTGRAPIPGPRGLPFFGSLFSLSHGLAHRTLSSMALSHNAKQLMSFSLGSTRAIISSDPNTAREILTSPHFANRPIKRSARKLMFERAVGFAPNGTYWRLLRRIATSHLFAPKRILAHEAGRQLDSATMLSAILNEQSRRGVVVLRKHLQFASLNNIMGTVFGKRYGPTRTQFSDEVEELREMVHEGFELLGAFNWSDYLTWLTYFYDPCGVDKRCTSLVARVKKFVGKIIEEHRVSGASRKILDTDTAAFVDVLLSLDGEEKLEDNDMIAILWEMIFRGTDTTALLTEWVMAELVLNPDVQAKLQNELDVVLGDKSDVTDADVVKLSYLQAVVKETLRVHPPGPLLSWARLSTSDVQLSNGMLIPANTVAMVNMWAITHDPHVWEEPLVFKPERFLKSHSGTDVDVRGCDLRLAPFGAGRRVCPGKNLGLVTVNLWVAKLVHHFKWVEDRVNPVDLSEVLKLSCEMKKPLSAVAVPRIPIN
ncbi:Cytochrome P450 [Dillenia turbinata]|uniref:Cytochrome P450 n=1 Tax=Dillenia turbinata TaxID=194707 RepID=A0AAN8VQ60_9MAGN